MALNLHQVPATHPVVVETAKIRQKLAAADSAVNGKNLCLVGYTHGGEITLIGGVSDPVTGLHSEQDAYENFGKECEKLRVNGLKIVFLYTERAPCGIGPGMKNCTGFLEKWLGCEIPVLYRYDYPSGGATETNAILAEIEESGLQIFGSDGVQENGREWLLELGKWDRERTTAALKAMDKPKSKE